MDLDGSLLNESVCSDDTEYLLGQNVSVREIEDTDTEEVDSSFPPKISITGLQVKKHPSNIVISSSTNIKQSKRIAENKILDIKNNNRSVKDIKRDKGSYEKSYNNVSNLRGTKNSKQGESNDTMSPRTREHNHVKLLNQDATLRGRKLLSNSFSSGSDDGALRPRVDQRLLGASGSEKVYALRKSKHSEKEFQSVSSPQQQILNSPPTKDCSAKKLKHKNTRQEMWRNNLSSSSQKWDTDSEPSTDILTSPYDANNTSDWNDEGNKHYDEDEDIDNSVMEKLKQLNLAVNCDDVSNEVCDDKVREGAELLSKLFGGSVDNYYSSSSDQSKSSLNQDESQTRNQADFLRENIAISLKSKKSQKPHRVDNSHSKNISDTTCSQSKQNGVRWRDSELQLSKGEQSYSHESVLASLQRAGDLQKEVRFKDEVGLLEDTTNIPRKQIKGEFVKETSAFRAAMDYSNDDDDDDVDEGEGIGVRHFGSEREIHVSSKLNQKNVVVSSSNIWTSQGIEFQEEQMKTACMNYKDEYYIKEDDGEVYSSWRHKRKEGQHRPVAEPTIGNFVTSTPQRNARRGHQVDESELAERTKLVLKKLQESENNLNKNSKVLKDLEFYIEEANARKKMLFDEIKSLEQSLKRNEAEMKSSEELAEEYRQEATKTRSQLMELETKREKLQQEVKEMEDLLSSQRQEAMDTIKTERKNEKKVIEITLERDQLRTEIESLKTQLHESETFLSSERKEYLKKAGLLQEQLHDEQQSSKETINKVKEQLEEERKKARESHYERISAIHKMQDEAKEMQSKEIESLRERLTRDRDFQLSQLKNEVKSRDNEIHELRSQIVKIQQEGMKKENDLREQLEDQDDGLRRFKAEIETWKQKENTYVINERNLEKLIEEKENELRRQAERSDDHIDEMQNVIESKEEEIRMIRGLVRQQEDATRLLGEQLRHEAKEQIRVALDKEREAAEQSRTRHQTKLDEMREKYEDTLQQLRNDLETERNTSLQSQHSLNKLKKEVERLRNLNLQAEEEKMNVLAQARSQTKEEVNKMKSKLEELTDVIGKSERETVMELNDEYHRNLSILGDSPMSKTSKKNLSNSFLNESSGSVYGSPTREALSNLKSCNDELRQHLVAARKELEIQKKEVAQRKESSEDLSHQQIVLFKKSLKSKDDEIAKLKRQLLEESKRNSLQIKSERAAYQNTIDRLEREQQVSSTPASSPVINGLMSPESGMSSSYSSAVTTPKTGTSPRTGDDSTTKLLRHLQGRVQQLRAQNENLRKSSDDSLNDSQSSIGNLSLDTTKSEQDADPGSHLQRLQLALKVSDDKSQKNAAMLSQKMMEMTKLQKMLTHATKENMKLERAYASLQRKIVDSSR